MSELSKIIPLTNDEKELYSRLDFEYFLKRHIESQNVNPDDVILIYQGYDDALRKIKNDRVDNKIQNHYFLEGHIRKMHSDGLLSTHFNLGAMRSFTIFRFEDYGENWAYFEVWSKRERKIRFRKMFWKRVVEFGAILGFILAAIHLYEIFTK